jgi:cytochrome oxidase assembly protein ShyY1
VLTLFREPKWVIFTLIVPFGILLSLLAADWQYTRHVDRSAQDALIRANSTVEPLPLDQVVAPGAEVSDDLEYRPVTVTGRFDANSTVLVRRRVLNGSAGFWVVTALRTANDSDVAVLRGWIPMTSGARDTPAIPPPPTGEVTVVGWLQPSQQTPVPPPTDLPAGQVAALDTAVLAGGALDYRPYLVASAMAPPDSAELTTIPVPNLGLGPHLAYSWQWLFFAAMFPAAWVILARREIKDLRSQSEESVGDTSPDNVPDRAEATG